MAFKTPVRYFVRGCLVAAPLGLTIYIVYQTLRAIDGWLPNPFPGLGILITVALIMLVGFLTSNVVGRTLVEWLEALLRRVPLVKLVYSSLRDLINAFMGDKKSFDRPVAVRLSRESGLRVLGFVTRDGLARIGLADCVSVYLPEAYNFAGNLLIAPRELVEPLDVQSSELMTFIVSGGVSGLGTGPTLLPPESKRSGSQPSDKVA